MKHYSYGPSSPFPPWIKKNPIWKWEENENKSKRGNKQTQSVIHFHEDGSVGCLCMCHWGKSGGKTGISPAMALFLSSHSDKMKLLTHTMGMLVHYHITYAHLILNKQNYINRVLVSGQSVLLRNKCFRMCKALCFLCSLVCSIKVCWLWWLRRCSLAWLTFLQSVNHMESERPGSVIFAQILMARVKLTLILFQIQWFTTHVD